MCQCWQTFTWFCKHLFQACNTRVNTFVNICLVLNICCRLATPLWRTLVLPGSSGSSEWAQPRRMLNHVRIKFRTIKSQIFPKVSNVKSAWRIPFRIQSFMLGISLQLQTKDMILCAKEKLILRNASCVTQHVASTLVSKHASIPTEESFLSSSVTLWVPPH